MTPGMNKEAGLECHSLEQDAEASRPQSPISKELDKLVRSQKYKIGCSMAVFTAVEVVISCISIDKLAGLDTGEAGTAFKKVLLHAGQIFPDF